jgi:polyribonucleotide nucleotidyltransferase
MGKGYRCFQREIEGHLLTIETGHMAGQANGAVTVRMGDTVILVTACMSPTPKEGGDFLPLTVDYEERLYAAGKIPGSFFRREGRPSQEAILAARLTDRSIRPLFPKGFCNEVQVIATVLSVDMEFQPDVLAGIGASAALTISDIPFDGPLGMCRVGIVGGQMVAFPSYGQLKESPLDLVVASTSDAVVMLEAGAKEVPEDLFLQAVLYGHRLNGEIVAFLQEIAREVGVPKAPFTPAPSPDPLLVDEIHTRFGEAIAQAVFSGAEKGERMAALEALLRQVTAALEERFPPQAINAAFRRVVRAVFRKGVLEEGRRPDGRSPREVRPITCQVGVLPRTHGTGLFRRGETQVLTITTLGSLAERQELDTLSPEESKRYIHHYNFPPYSTGEVRRIGSPGRREVGHGALAERALLPLIPSEEEFPYTIRLVSEVMSSNGSTSMASVCGSSLSLMDAGVPLPRHVAGIAIGLVTGEDGRYRVLTDIQGLEDHEGDMDFKVAGTERGITAVQMDVKIRGITEAILREALEQAREARLLILKRMEEAIAAPRSTVSPYAPKVLRMTIPVEKIGTLIGPGGKMIRSIIEQTKTTIDVGDDGTVLIGSPDPEAVERARALIAGLVQEVKVGDIYTGKVTRLIPLGAFVEILPGKEGMVPLSELSDRRLSRPEEEVKVGDEVTVVVTEIDRLGRINLSRKALFRPLAPGGPRAPTPPRAQPPPPPRRPQAIPPGARGSTPGRPPPPPPRGSGGQPAPRRGP